MPDLRLPTFDPSSVQTARGRVEERGVEHGRHNNRTVRGRGTKRSRAQMPPLRRGPPRGVRQSQGRTDGSGPNTHVLLPALPRGLGFCAGKNDLTRIGAVGRCGASAGVRYETDLSDDLEGPGNVQPADGGLRPRSGIAGMSTSVTHDSTSIRRSLPSTSSTRARNASVVIVSPAYLAV